MKKTIDGTRVCFICGKRKPFTKGYWESINKKTGKISANPQEGTLEWVCYLCSLKGIK